MLKETVKELLPPDEDGRPLSLITRWRIVVFAVCVSMLLFMVWALSPYGFALADDLRLVKKDVSEMQITQMEQGVYSLKEWECSSTDKGAQRFFSEKITEINRRYQQIVGSKIDIPPCRSGEHSNDPR